MVTFCLATTGNDNYVRDKDEKFSVISIIGSQGTGKTTLARSVYNARKVKKHFDIKVWLCVSEKLDVKSLMIEIIESACIDRPHDLHRLINLDTIQRILNQELKGKRFLIVFDDITSGQINAGWKTLWPSFKLGKKGSKIILTTCDQDVEKTMKMEKINLKSKEEDEDYRRSLSGGVNPTDLPTKEPRGRHVAPKLGESPLASEPGRKVMQSKL